MIDAAKALITPESKEKAHQRFMPIFRGLYPIFSQPRDSYKRVAHCDTHFFQVGGVMYLNNVGKDEGAFMVWPGSHRIIAPHAKSIVHNHIPDEFEELCSEIQCSIQPVHITGKTGTIILWHHRLLHAARNNSSGGIRNAVLCDFKNGLADSRLGDNGGKVFDDSWSLSVLNEDELLVSEHKRSVA
jgi:ectoine hydroxylase-related dioxygenase (phytanoyl-CoA dioxygenase family)